MHRDGVFNTAAVSASDGDAHRNANLATTFNHHVIAASQAIECQLQSAKTIVYTLTNGPVDPATWVDFVSYADESTFPLYPGTAVIIRNYGATAKSFTSSGAVKTGKTQVDVLPGDNLIAPPYAVGNSFNGMNLAPQLLDQSDEVITLSPSQAATTYYSYNDLSTIQMVDFVTYDPMGTLVITEGTGFFVRRPTAGSSTVTFAAQVVTP